jgi:hypothetical protein
MKIPEKVKIGGFEYEIVKSEIVLNPENDACYGTHEFTTLRINIAEKYAGQVQKATLIHEIIHAISDVYHLDFKESTVQKLGDALYQVIIDNPEMFK